MNKKLFKLFLILLIPLLLTGCRSKYEYTIKVNNDNTLEANLYYKSENYQDLSEDFFIPYENLFNDMRNNGYNVSFNHDNDYSVVTINKTFNLDEITTTDEKLDFKGLIIDYNKLKLLNIKRKNDSKIYTANWEWRYGQYVYNENENKFYFWSSEQGENDIDIAFIYPSLGNSFKVELPVKPLSSNASRTENNGKTLLWDLEDVGFNNIQFSFELNADTLIKLKTNKIKLLTDDIKEGDKVLLSIDKALNKEDILITDEDKNNIQFEIDKDILSFIMPNKKVSIDIKEPKNPDTGYSYLLFSIIFLVIISSFLIIRRIKIKEE